jgi:hypothetical protein
MDDLLYLLVLHHWHMYCNRHMNHFLLHHRHWNVVVNICVNVLRALLRDYPWHMHNLLDHHGHRNMHNLLNAPVLDALLLNDLRDVNDLLSLPHLHLWDLLNLDNFMHCWNLDNMLLHGSGHSMLLVDIHCLWGVLNFTRLALGILGWCSFGGVHGLRSVHCDRGLLISFLMEPIPSDLGDAAAYRCWLNRRTSPCCN